mgnify:FL=1
MVIQYVDTIYLVDLLFDTMVNMDHDQSGEALVYCCGAVKFLAGNKALSATLSRKCTLYTLASILNKINKQVCLDIIVLVIP